MDLVLEAKRLHQKEATHYRGVMPVDDVAIICADYSYQTLDMAFEEVLIRTKGSECVQKRMQMYDVLKQCSTISPLIHRYLSRLMATHGHVKHGAIKHAFELSISFQLRYCNRLACYYPNRTCTCGKKVI